jgi:hypothetical protein
MVIREVKVFVFHCDACGYQSEPQYSRLFLPQGWEPLVIENQEMALCAAHRYGLNHMEIEILKAIALKEKLS